MENMLSLQARARIAIRGNLRRRRVVNAMHLPYGSHCKAWAIHNLNQQLLDILTFVQGEMIR